MKLTLFFLTASFLSVQAAGVSQTVTLSGNNMELRQVFAAIKKQTGFFLFYDSSALRGAVPVTITAHKQPLEDFLEEILQPQHLSYTIKNKTIAISRRMVTTPEVLVNNDLLFSNAPFKGTVKNEDGIPLEGATVSLVNSAAGKDESAKAATPGSFVIITNSSGGFQMNVPSGKYIVTISYVGYTRLQREVTIDNKTVTINFVLKNSDAALKTVTISTGYQQISAERMTGAFDNIKKSQVEKPTTNIAERLIGTTAGMQVKIDVDNNPTIEVRGKTTLNANSTQGANMPLIVIDGFPQSTRSSNPFNSINPNDVESITVLKDAAAASIWGAKSANGVIVITTKKGSKGTPLRVDFSVFTRVSAKQNVSYMTGFAGAAEIVDFEQLGFKKWGGSVNSGTIFGNFRTTPANTLLNENNLGYITSAQLNAGLAQLKTQDNRSQVSDYLLSNPTNTQYSLILSGGGQKMTNLLSMLVEQNQSNFKSTNNRKYSINYRTSASVVKWLDFDLSGTFQYDKSNNNGIQLNDIKNIAPYSMLKNPDGSLTDIYQYYQPTMLRLVPLAKFAYPFNYNPIQETENTDNTNVSKTVRIQAGLTFKILPGLTYRSSIQYENFDQNSRSYRNDQTFYVRNQVNTSSTWNQTLAGTVTRNLPLGGLLDQSRGAVEAYNFRNQANFSRIFSGKHEINIVAGTEVSNAVTRDYSYPRTYGYDDKTLAVGTFPNGVTGTRDWNGFTNNFAYLSSYGYRTQRFYSLFANAAYTYNDKYTVSGSYRTDASNLIATDPRYRYSPFFSAGIAYAISRENFMKDITWLDRLNLRATYGRTGNVDISTSPYTLITQQPADRYTNDATARINGLGNPALTWEKTQTVNLGLDFSILHDKLYGKIDVYNKNGKDLLASIALPTVVGASFSRFNNAAINNKGIEVTLGTTLPLKGNDILWNGNFNLSYNKGKVTTLLNSTYDVSSLVQGGSSAYSEGFDPNTAWAYQYAGVVNGNPMIKGPSGTLLPLNSYLSGDGRGYLQNMGTTSPRYILGTSHSFKIYDFNVSFIVIAKFGAVFQGQYFNFPVSGSYLFPNSKLSSVLNGDPSKIVTLPTDPNNSSYNSWIATNRFLNYTYLNANLARLQEVNVSYNLPRRWFSKMNFSGAQVILQGNNLYTWLANKTGEDPEYRIGNVKPRAQYTLGIKFQL